MKADRTMDRYVHDERDPLGAWVDWYVSAEHRDEPGTGCPVAALIGDVNRCNDHIRDGYDALVDRYIGVVAGMLGGGDDARRQAIMAVSASSDRSSSPAPSTTTRTPRKSWEPSVRP